MVKKTIVLGYKGSSKSGNYAHAGRQGKVGGSMPRNYGAASAALGALQAGWSSLSSNWIVGVDPTTLNRQGLQAIIDLQAGNITDAQAQAIIGMPSSQKGNQPNPNVMSLVGTGVMPPATPPPAPTPVVTPPAQPTYQPIPAGQPHAGYVPTQADVDAAKATLAALQDPNDPRGAVHSSWAVGIDPNNLTSSQIKVLSIYGSGGMRGATLKSAMAAQQPATATATAATPPPAPSAPPAPPKDPRFYQGDVTGKSAQELFDGSSKEIQDLALKTGIIATDAATLKYVQAMDHKFGKQPGYPQIYQKYISNEPSDSGKDIDGYVAFLNDPSKFGTRYSGNIHGWAVDMNGGTMRASSYNDAAKALTGLKPEEKALISKLAAHKEDSRKAFNTAYNSKVGSYNAKIKEADDAEHKALIDGWKSLTPAEQKMAVDLTKRAAVCDWVNANVPYTLPGSTKSTPSSRWRPLTIDKAPALDNAADIKKFGFEYRNTLVAKPLPMPTGGYDKKELLGISSLAAKREQQVRDQFTTSWDHANHTFKGEVRNAFQIHPQKEVQDKFEVARKAKDNEMTDLYHGTHYIAARSIAATGYIVPKSAKAGRAMGDGVYLADKSSKSAQYIWDPQSGGWGTGREGVLMLNKASRGKEITLNSWQSNNWQQYDTVFGARGVGLGTWRNNEWAVKDPGAVLPDVWLDVRTW